MVNEVPQIKAEGNKDPFEIDWDDVSCDDEATQIQAGYRGMVAREKMEAEESEIKKEIADRGQAIEDHLGINLSDPEVIAATTKIQAGFREGELEGSSFLCLANTGKACKAIDLVHHFLFLKLFCSDKLQSET